MKRSSMLPTFGTGATISGGGGGGGGTATGALFTEGCEGVKNALSVMACAMMDFSVATAAVGTGDFVNICVGDCPLADARIISTNFVFSGVLVAGESPAFGFGAVAVAVEVPGVLSLAPRLRIFVG